MNKKAKKKNPLKLKACVVALSLWGFAVFTFSSSPVMAAETASNVAQEAVAIALYNKGVVLGKLHRIGQARAELEELVYRFKDNPDVNIQKIVAAARHF